MKNFDGKISAIFMNIASDTDSKESYKYFKESVKHLMEEYAKEKLENFIDDHFPENSKDHVTSLAEETEDLKPGEYYHFFSAEKEKKQKELQERIDNYFRNTKEDTHSITVSGEGFGYGFVEYPRHGIKSFEFINREEKESPDVSFVGDSLDHVKGSWIVELKRPEPGKPFTEYDLEHPYRLVFKEDPIAVLPTKFKVQENPVPIKKEHAKEVKIKENGVLSAFSDHLKRWVDNKEETKLGTVKIIGDEICYFLKF